MSKSVGDSGSVPQWMRDTANRLNFNDDLMSNSPPSNDGFLISFPVTKKRFDENDPTITASSALNNAIEKTTANQFEHFSQMESDFNSVQSVDFSKECKKYISRIDDAKAQFINTSKPKGTDDDFKTAACAGSLVQVAQKFVGNPGIQFSKKFTVAKINDDDDHAPSLDEPEEKLRNDPHLMQRRDSRSLPASPFSSPRTMRKFQPQPNPYFTITNGDNNAPKQSWFLTSLFGVRRELTSSTASVSSQIEEAEEMVEPTTSAPNTEIKPLDTSKLNDEKTSTNVKAKPTMLREMNFFAPTSY
jgi:hypothetical protein